LHRRHLAASSFTVSGSCPSGTSLKFLILTFGSCSGIGYFLGTILAATHLPPFSLSRAILSSSR
jgi:hypothetical protein